MLSDAPGEWSILEIKEKFDRIIAPKHPYPTDSILIHSFELKKKVVEMDVRMVFRCKGDFPGISFRSKIIRIKLPTSAVNDFPDLPFGFVNVSRSRVILNCEVCRRGSAAYM